MSLLKLNYFISLSLTNALCTGMLDQATTVMAIWPAPMIYGGPTEVLFHAKSRRNAGATYFVAGRDPAGMKGKFNKKWKVLFNTF